MHAIDFFNAVIITTFLNFLRSVRCPYQEVRDFFQEGNWLEPA